MSQNEEVNVEEKCREMEQQLKEWNENRCRVIEELRAIAREVGDWEFGTSVSNIVGSSASVVGGVALFAGILFPPLAMAGVLLGAAGGVSNVGTGVAKNLFLKGKAERIQFLLKNELDDFEKLISNHKALTKFINNQIEFDMMKSFKPEKTIPKVFDTFGRLFKKQTAKSVLNAATFVAMSFDVIAIAENANIIANKIPNEFEKTVNELSNELENHRQDVMSKLTI